MNLLVKVLNSGKYSLTLILKTIQGIIYPVLFERVVNFSGDLVTWLIH